MDYRKITNEKALERAMKTREKIVNFPVRAPTLGLVSRKVKEDTIIPEEIIHFHMDLEVGDKIVYFLLQDGSILATNEEMAKERSEWLYGEILPGIISTDN